MDAHQEMDMVGFPTEFDQGTAPMFQDLYECLP